MKSLQWLFLTFLIIFNAKAQDCTSYKFVDSENVLKYKTSYDGNTFGSAKITFSKDSFLLKERYYKKLILLDFELYDISQEYYFREDKGQVYMFLNDTETLIFDFCLDVGDIYDSEWKVINKSDISTDLNATTRSQIILQNNSGQIQKWIEGLGGNKLKLSSLNLFLCEFYSKDFDQIYYESLSDCKSPVHTSYVSHENKWHFTVPQWTNPGFDYWNSFSSDSFLIGNKYYRKSISQVVGKTEWEESSIYYREHFGRIFFKYKDSDEQLSYNFSAEVGDTLFPKYDKNTAFVVTNVENISTLDGISRRKLSLDKICAFMKFPITWIEGIGETKKSDGLELGCIIFDPEPQFNCFTTNNKLVYSNSFCYTSVQDVNRQSSISLLPNPVIDQLQIMGNTASIASLQISDLSGRILKNKVLHDDTTINVETIPLGIYFCKILFLDGQVQVLKFIKI
jgi:hypothetical protein